MLSFPCKNVKYMCLQSSLVAESDGTKFGLNIPHPPPDYADGVYLSERCRPSAGEHLMLRALSQRPKTTLHDAALAISANQAAAADSVEDFIRVSMLYVSFCVEIFRVLPYSVLSWLC